MSSRKIEDCHPLLLPLAQRFIEQCARKDLDVLVTCTWRSPQEQDDLYAQGRTKPGKIVTNARAGQSAHNVTLHGLPAACAIDIVPLRYGKPVWGLSGDGIDENPADDERDDLELWQRVRAVAEAEGLFSASRWATFKEWPHLELPNWKVHA